MNNEVFKNHSTEAGFNNLIDSFFSPFSSIYRDDNGAGTFKQFAPVNVKETETAFVVELMAPGFNKEDFMISLDKNVLSISADVKREEEDKKEQLLRKEYKFQSFKRSFTIKDSVETDNISAQYVNGILILQLPKKTEVTKTKQITIK